MVRNMGEFIRCVEEASKFGVGPQSRCVARKGDFGAEHVVTLTKEPIIDEAADIPPSCLSIDPNSLDFHPSYVRVGVRVDGKERNDLQRYDVKRLEYMTTDKTSHLAESIEPYWRFAESRQQRRARERWEGKHK